MGLELTLCHGYTYLCAASTLLSVPTNIIVSQIIIYGL